MEQYLKSLELKFSKREQKILYPLNKSRVPWFNKRGTIREQNRTYRNKKIWYLKVLGIPMTTHTFSDSLEGLRDGCKHGYYLLQQKIHSRIIKGKTHQAESEGVQLRLPKFFLWAAWGCCREHALAYSSEIQKPVQCFCQISPLKTHSSQLLLLVIQVFSACATSHNYQSSILSGEKQVFILNHIVCTNNLRLIGQNSVPQALKTLLSLSSMECIPETKFPGAIFKTSQRQRHQICYVNSFLKTETENSIEKKDKIEKNLLRIGWEERQSNRKQKNDKTRKSVQEV